MNNFTIKTSKFIALGLLLAIAPSIQAQSEAADTPFDPYAAYQKGQYSAEVPAEEEILQPQFDIIIEPSSESTPQPLSIEPATAESTAPESTAPESAAPESTPRDEPIFIDIAEPIQIDPAIIATEVFEPERFEPEILDVPVFDAPELIETQEAPEVIEPAFFEPELLEPEPAPLETKTETLRSSATPAATPLKAMAFHATAADYLKFRGDQDGPAARLVYEVATTQNSAVNIKNVTLTIGTDYISKTFQGSNNLEETHIYDFKLNRILRLTQNALRAQDVDLTNSSLFALAYRNISTVRAQTKQGRLSQINLGKDVMIDSFWVEAAMGWSGQDTARDVRVQTDGAVTKGYFKEKKVISFEYDDAPYKSPEMADVMFAFAHIDMPIHPELLKPLYAAQAPIKSMTIHNVTPQFLGGYEQTWTLKNRESVNTPFPLPLDAKSVLEHETAPMLAIIMRRAAQGVAAGGRETMGDIADTIIKAASEDDHVTAWLAGQRYLSYGNAASIKSCLHPDACAAMGALVQSSDKSPELEALISAFEDANSADRKVIGVKALTVWLDDNPPHAAVLRTLAKASATIPKGTAVAAEVETPGMEDMLSSALLADPYDKQNYMGLAQYYSAVKDYGSSWDIYDSMRAVLMQAESQSLTINRVETRLTTQAPGYFVSTLN